MLRRGNREFALQSRWDQSLLGLTETLRRETERLQSHLSETEIPIGETDLPRVCGSGYDISTWRRRIERIGGAELDFWFGSSVDVRK